MKIKFTEHRELAGGKTVKPGDEFESPRDGSDDLLQAYINNGIAVDVFSPQSLVPSSKKEVKPDEH
jgi:hypothetical protein